jgi:hypothetical protein
LTFASESFLSTATFYVPVLALNHFHLELIYVKLLFLNCTLFTLLLFILFSLFSDARNASFYQGVSYAALQSGILISRVAVSFVNTKESLIIYCFVLMFLWLLGLIRFAVHLLRAKKNINRFLVKWTVILVLKSFFMKCLNVSDLQLYFCLKKNYQLKQNCCS